MYIRVSNIYIHHNFVRKTKRPSAAGMTLVHG